MQDKFGNEIKAGNKVVFLHHFYQGSVDMIRATMTGTSGEKFITLDVEDPRANEKPSMYCKPIPRKVLAERTAKCY